MFPQVVAFMADRNVALPHWLNSKTALPWNSKEEFYQAKNSKNKQYTELFELLTSTKGYQAEFLAQRLNYALPKILNSLTDNNKKAVIEKRFNQLLKSVTLWFKEYGDPG